MTGRERLAWIVELRAQIHNAACTRKHYEPYWFTCLRRAADK